MALPSTQNRVVIDGFDHTSSITGEPVGAEGPARVPYQLSQWAVNAFRVNLSAAPAEIGRASAAVIDVVTKSGANQLRASGYEFFGNRALVGHKVLDEQAGLDAPAYRSNQFGAVVGGPILKDHNFFLVSYDGLQRIDSASASPNTTLFSAGNSAALNAIVARTTRDQDQDLVLARTDHQYFGQHLTLRYVDQQFAGQAIDEARIQPAVSSNGRSYLRNRSGAGSLATSSTTRVFNTPIVTTPKPHPPCPEWPSGRVAASSRRRAPACSDRMPLRPSDCRWVIQCLLSPALIR